MCFPPPPQTGALTSIQQKLDFLDIKDEPRGTKRKKKSRSTASESDAYVNANLSQSASSSDEPLGDEVGQDIAGLGVPITEGSEMPAGLSNKQFPPPYTSDPVNRTYTRHRTPDLSTHSMETAICAMCGNIHRGTCGMTGRSENLVHYRQILFTNQTGESFEDRVRLLKVCWL